MCTQNWPGFNLFLIFEKANKNFLGIFLGRFWMHNTLLSQKNDFHFLGFIHKPCPTKLSKRKNESRKRISKFMEPNSNIMESEHFTFFRFTKLEWLHQRYLMIYTLWITPLPLCIMKLISRSILNCKFIGAPWPCANMGLWGPA